MAYKHLTEEFLAKYRGENPLKSELGMFTYVRTYSKFLPQEKRREYWIETVARAVDYNISLGNATQKEAEALFHNIFNLKQFLSGRTLWSGGHHASLNYPMSNYNCAFGVADEIDFFSEAFYLLLIGAGVGFRATYEDVEKLPNFKNNIKLNFKEYEPVMKLERTEYTGTSNYYDEMNIIIGDSKEGWYQALKYYLDIMTDSMYKKINIININFDNVRPKGERLHGFGGFASGHESLKLMFNKIHTLVSSLEDGKLNPTDAIEVLNMIGEGVVSGGVRRTAEIALIDVTDKTSIQMKNNLYKLTNGEWVVNEDILHRQMSNNSIYYKEKPSREFFKWQLNQMRYSGEPKYIGLY